MKNKTLQLQITSPCAQDWAEMQPRGVGRHCGQCDRVIVDFTDISDGELVRLFQFHKGKLCGRFRANQLNREIPIPLPAASTAYRAAGALLSGLLLAGGAMAQTPSKLSPMEMLPTLSTSPQPAASGKPIVRVFGCVTDENGEPLIAATVWIQYPGKEKRIIGTDTDIHGFFSFMAPKAGWVDLFVYYTGYEERTFKMELNKQPEELHIVLQTGSSGGLVLIGVTVYTEKEEEDTTNKGLSIFKKKEVRLSVQAYPNPFVDHLQVKMTLDKADTYLFCLYNTTGQLVFAESLKLGSGHLTVGLSLPHDLPAAGYSLRITRGDELIGSQPLVKQ